MQLYLLDKIIPALKPFIIVMTTHFPFFKLVGGFQNYSNKFELQDLVQLILNISEIK